MNSTLPPKKGRGHTANPTGRFESHQVVTDEYVQPRPREILDGDEEIEPSPRTQFFDDHARTIIASNDSPDLPFTFSLNPYRGCEHGCIYCYARPTHEYLGLSAGLDFETKIFVKKNAPELLRQELLAKKWKPETITISGVTDCYQPAEKRFQLTRKCLEVLNEFRNPYAIISKNHLVTRDLDLFQEMAQFNGVFVMISITSLQDDLISVLEPRTSRPLMRRAIETLAKAGIPVGVNVAPIIPGLTDHELPSILKAAADAGAITAGYTIVRLPYGLKDLFTEWAQTHFPDRKDKIIHRIEEMRDGKLYRADFGSRMKGEGVFAEQMQNIFNVYTKKYGLNEKRVNLSAAHFRRVENKAQGELF
jgi:DNA repair photolyase